MKIRNGLWLLSMSLLAACGGGGGTSNAPASSGASTATSKFLYVFNTFGAVDIYSINSATGALTQIPASSFDLKDQPAAAYLNDGASVLYVLKGGHWFSNSGIHGTNPTVSALAIDKTTGGLTEMEGSPYPINDSAPVNRLLFHPSNRFLYLLDSDRITGYAIDAVSGRLAATPGSPYLESSSASMIGGGVFDQSGQHVFIIRDNAVDIYSLNSATGALSLDSSIAYDGFLPTRPVLSKNGSFLYFSYSTITADFKFPKWMAGYSINSATGKLTGVSGAPYALGESAGPPVLQNSGGYIYVVENAGTYGPGSIAAFVPDTVTGQLTPVPKSPFATGGNAASGPVMFSRENFLAVPHDPAAPDGHGISVFGIDAGTGTLTAATPSTLTVSGIYPNSLHSMDPATTCMFWIE